MKPVDPLLIDVPERLQTTRLVLRPPRAGDGVALNDAVCASIQALQPWMPWAQQAPGVDQSEADARGAYAKFLQRSDLVYSIWLHDGDGREAVLVGGTGLHRFDWLLRRFEIGYWIRSGHGGQGYATEAVQALNRMAFDTLAAQRVEIRMDERNLPSRCVAERAGFTFEGTLRRDALDTSGAPRNTRVYARVKGAEEA